MTNICEHYHSKEKMLHDKTITGDRNPRRPDIFTVEWCTHDKSKIHTDTISDSRMQCKGSKGKCHYPEI